MEKFWGKKVFKKILGMGEWAPLFFGAFQPYPPLDIPQGVSRGTCLAWHGMGLVDQGLDGQATGHRQGHRAGHRWRPGRPRELPDRPVG